MEEEGISAASEKLSPDNRIPRMLAEDLLVECQVQTERGQQSELLRGPTAPTIPSEGQSSGQEDDEHNEVISSHNSENCSNEKVEEQESFSPSVDVQSLKQSSRSNDSELHREEILSEDVQTGEVRVNDSICAQLQHAIADIAILKQEACKEYYQRLKAEREALRASRGEIASERLYAKEKKQRIRANEDLLDLVLKFKTIRNERDVILEELHEIQKQKESLETEAAVFQERLTASEHLINSVEKDHALQTAEGLRTGKLTANIPKARNVIEFSFLELEHATRGFDNSLKIGENSYRSVYGGFLRHTMVAIKICFQLMSSQQEFLQEVDTLGRLRHPNLVDLIGICTETQSLVFEFLPKGSLEDYLDRPGNSKHLGWKARISTVIDICSTLIFLHSCKPVGIIHGNLKPSNILFDAHFKSKLCDFHINHGSPAAIEDGVYVDPEFLSTGKLTTKSDIYSFGVIVLRLLTGRPAFGIIEEVTIAMEKENLQDILDKSAGQWPFVQAKQLLHLALRCCQLNSHDRPDLADDVWRVLEPMKGAATPPGTPFLLPNLEVDDVPSYFLCPILQDVMNDPHVAADGFTYEAEAIRAWFGAGHNTSPMTNVKLHHQELLPNHALRSVIQEWLQQKCEQH